MKLALSQPSGAAVNLSVELEYWYSVLHFFLLCLPFLICHS